MKSVFTFFLRVSVLIFSIFNVNAQTFFDMSSGNFSEDFSDIANWTNNYASGSGAENWRVATSVASSTVNNATVFVSGTTGGIQKGTGKIVMLATGTNSGATDILLDFSGRVAGTISLDWEKIVNTANASPRSSELKIQYSTDNSVTFTDLTVYTLPRIFNDNNAESGTLSVIALPSDLDNVSEAVIRLYVWNNGQTGGAGNRPKYASDNIIITSTPSASELFINSNNVAVTENFNSFLGTEVSLPVGWTTSFTGTPNFGGTNTGTSTTGAVYAY